MPIRVNPCESACIRVNPQVPFASFMKGARLMAGTQESNRSITIGRPQAMPGAANATPGFSTLALRAGYDPADHLNASSVPIYATAAYALHDEEHATAIASF